MVQINKTINTIKSYNIPVRTNKFCNIFISYLEFKYLKNIKKLNNNQIGNWIKNKLVSLGPTFVKIGQFMSTRSDVFGEEITFELKELQDNVLPLPYEELEEYINPILLNIETIDKLPIASASIGQVHLGTLKTGEKIVLKIKRPNIENQISEDFELLLFMINLLKNISDDRQINEFEILFNEYYKLLKEEIDFKREARTMQVFKSFFKDKKWLKVPKVYVEYSNENVIIMEYVPSIKIDDLESINKLNFNKEKIAEKLIELFINQIVDAGLVHIDPHPGNLGITENGKIVFYDFGMVLNIDFKVKEKFTSFLIAVYDKDINKICQIAIDIGLINVKPENIPYFKAFLISFLAYVERADIEEFKISYINKISKSEKAPFLVSSKFILLFRGISILEGICKKLDPYFNFKKPLDPYIDQFVIDINYFEKKAMNDLNLFYKVPDNVVNSQIQLEVLEKNIRDVERVTQQEQRDKYYQIIGLLFTLFIEYEFDKGLLAWIFYTITYLLIINNS